MSSQGSTSREERRANRQIVKIENAKELAPSKVARELYEETRPRGAVYCRDVVFIDDESRYGDLVRPMVADWDELLEQLDERGIFNPRCISSRAKRLELIASVVEDLISRRVVLYDVAESKFWLSLATYQVEAVRDECDREERRSRNAQRTARKRTRSLVDAA